MPQRIPRIPLLEREDVPPDTAALYDALLAQRGVVPNMFKVLAYSPGIAQGVAGFLRALLSDGALTGWYKELVAVRVSILLESEYAVTAHKASAAKKGATGEQIASRAARGGRRLLRGVEDRVRGHRIGGIVSHRGGLRNVSALHRRPAHSRYA